MVSFSPRPKCADVLLPMHVRDYRPDDASVLAEIYRDSARELGREAYSPEQIAAWASFPDDFAAFRERLGHGVSLVSLEGEAIAAFGQLDPMDHVALLYTNPRYARRGHATLIYQRLEAIARSHRVRRLRTTASWLSRPLFSKQGFILTEVEHTHFKGVEFERFKMEKPLAAT